MKYIITGASGFIGTNLLGAIVERGNCVINIDCAEPRDNGQLSYWHQCDICDYDRFRNEILAFEPDYIIHLAARTDLDGKSVDDYAANTQGVENLLKIVNEAKSVRKVIITSSMLVCHAGYQAKDQFDYAPTTLYGSSKVVTEKMVWKNTPQCDWAIIRPTSIWGEWFSTPYKDFFDRVVAGRYFHIGRKSCTKTYGYVGNAIYQILRILETDTSCAQERVYYIGDYAPTNIEEWGEAIGRQCGVKILRIPFWIIWCAAIFGDILKLFHVPFPMVSFRLYNMTTDNVINLERTEKVAPDLPFDQATAIHRTLKWMNVI